MRKMIMLLTLITGVSTAYGAKDTASVQINVTARVVESATVKTKALGQGKVSIALNEMNDEYGKLKRTVVTSCKTEVKKNEENLYVLNLLEEQENDIVVLTVINS